MAELAQAAAVLAGDRTRHKIALRLLPFLFLLYIVNFVDRTNLGFAAIGMARDLGFSDRAFGLGAGIFFASYMALQIPVKGFLARLICMHFMRQCFTVVFFITAPCFAQTQFPDTPAGHQVAAWFRPSTAAIAKSCRIFCRVICRTAPSTW